MEEMKEKFVKKKKGLTTEMPPLSVVRATFSARFALSKRRKRIQ